MPAHARRRPAPISPTRRIRVATRMARPPGPSAPHPSGAHIPAGTSTRRLSESRRRPSGPCPSHRSRRHSGPVRRKPKPPPLEHKQQPLVGSGRPTGVFGLVVTLRVSPSLSAADGRPTGARGLRLRHDSHDSESLRRSSTNTVARVGGPGRPSRLNSSTNRRRRPAPTGPDGVRTPAARAGRSPPAGSRRWSGSALPLEHEPAVRSADLVPAAVWGVNGAVRQWSGFIAALLHAIATVAAVALGQAQQDASRRNEPAGHGRRGRAREIVVPRGPRGPGGARQPVPTDAMRHNQER